MAGRMTFNHLVHIISSHWIQYVRHLMIYLYIKFYWSKMLIFVNTVIYLILQYIYSYTVLDIIKFTYYHNSSVDYSILCEWIYTVLQSTTQIVLHLSTMLSHTCTCTLLKYMYSSHLSTICTLNSHVLY